MLKLSRKINETIMIGDDIKISVLSFDGIKVNLGISAPRHVPVYRTEIYTRIKQQQIKQMNDKKYRSDTYYQFGK